MSNKWLCFGCGFIVLFSGMSQFALGQEVGSLSSGHPKMLALKKQVALIENSINETDERLNNAKVMIQKFEAQMARLGEQLSEFNVSEVSYPEVLMQLQVQRINLSIEKAGLDAKSDKLTELVGKEQKPSENSERKRAKLQELLALEEQGLQRLNELHKTGVVPSTELLEARKRMIQVELQLLDLDSPQPAKSPEAVWASDLLAKSALERVEVSAKLAAVEELLRPLQHVRSKLLEMQSLKNEAGAWEAEKSQLQTRQMEFQNRLLDLKSQLGEAGEQDE